MINPNELEEKNIFLLKSNRVLKYAGKTFLDNKQDAINLVLTKVVDEYKLENAFIFKNYYTEESLNVKLTNVISTHGDKYYLDNELLKNISFKNEGYNRYIDKFEKGELVTGGINDFGGIVRSFIEIFNINYIWFIPIFVNNKWYGLLGTFTTDNKFVNRDYINSLSDVSVLIGSYYCENRFDKKNNEEYHLANDKIILKKEFIHDISNVFKKPLNNVLNFSSLLVKCCNDLDADKILTFSEIIRSSSETLYVLFDNVQTCNKINNDEIIVNRESVDLYDIIKKALSFLEGMINQKGIVIVNNIIDSVYVYTDKEMLFVVILNIIHNSVKFSEKEGEIIIDVKKKLKKISCIISDSGVGMSESLVRSINEQKDVVPFYGTYGEKGAGLGLKICGNFVENLNANLIIDSVLRKGTRINIELNKGENAKNITE